MAHFIAADYTPTHIDILGRPISPPEVGPLIRLREVGTRLESAADAWSTPKNSDFLDYRGPRQPTSSA